MARRGVDDLLAQALAARSGGRTTRHGIVQLYTNVGLGRGWDEEHGWRLDQMQRQRTMLANVFATSRCDAGGVPQAGVGR